MNFPMHTGSSFSFRTNQNQNRGVHDFNMPFTTPATYMAEDTSMMSLSSPLTGHRQFQSASSRKIGISEQSGVGHRWYDDQRVAGVTDGSLAMGNSMFNSTGTFNEIPLRPEEEKFHAQFLEMLFRQSDGSKTSQSMAGSHFRQVRIALASFSLPDMESQASFASSFSQVHLFDFLSSIHPTNHPSIHSSIVQ